MRGVPQLARLGPPARPTIGQPFGKLLAVHRAPMVDPPWLVAARVVCSYQDVVGTQQLPRDFKVRPSVVGSTKNNGEFSSVCHAVFPTQPYSQYSYVL